MASFELSFSIRIQLEKKKLDCLWDLEGEIAFASITFFHIYNYKSLQAVELPREHFSFLQNLLNFIITKYLK